MPDAPTPRERPTDDEAALRAAVERLDGYVSQWVALSGNHFGQALKAKGTPEYKPMFERALQWQVDALALALVLRRVRETMEGAGG